MKEKILFIALIGFISSGYFCFEYRNDADNDQKTFLIKYLNRTGANNNETISKQFFSLNACKQSLIRCIFLSIVLGLLILFTIIGNSFVIIAVFIDRNLHNVANYLIVSLAFADLTVAVMVMPIGAYQEVFREWSLGKILCDIWTIFDVLCCTASILHLVAIALDRYWAITKFGYASSRTPKLIFTFITIIWSVSLVVAVSPHIFGLSYDVNNTERCHLTDHLTYQLVSTVAAFYLPLIGMCVIYWKIFRTAKLRIRKKAFKKGSPLSKNERKKKKKDKKPKISNLKSSDFSLNSAEKESKKCSCEKSKKDKVFSWSLVKTLPSIQKENSSVNSTNINQDYTIGKLLREDSSFFDTKAAFTNGEYKAFGYSLEYMTIRQGDKDHTNNDNTLINKKTTLITEQSSYLTRVDKQTKRYVDPDQVSNILKKRAYIDLKRERKAAKTLGVIMSCFIVCWLPYFLMQIFFAVCKNCYLTKMLENSYVVTFLTWSGYLNSMLNPVIYTIFSPDFRNAFTKIFFGKFRL